MTTVAALTLLLAAVCTGLPTAGAGEPARAIVLIHGLEVTDPLFVLIVLDARDGKDTWSILEDPMILVTVGSRGEEGSVTYVDEGFLTQGRPSGAFLGVGGATLDDLAGLLEAGYTSASSRQGL